MSTAGIAGSACAAALAALLGGCATLDREEVRARRVARPRLPRRPAGLRLRARRRHQDACSEFGIRVDREAYRAGYEEGLSAYCSRTDPYRLGLDGGPYRDVCSAAFGREYRVGKRIHDYRERIERLEDEIRSLRADMDAAESDAERRDYRREIARHHDQIDELRRKILATRLLREDADTVIDIIDLAD
ncbi:MAG: DUF2799 domain-containing protein [Halofilum sp. (in: g-proteobacteria)]|nr:DUF2799 domain-containing protein [Halofilum sp. (in: g-proteobacteria)]